MSWYTKLFFMFCRLVSTPVLALVRPNIVQVDDGLRDAVAGRPVCYVLRTYSWTDRFLLERILRAEGLTPLHRTPGKLPVAEKAGCLYLPVIAGDRGADRSTATMETLMAGQGEQSLQIVPVSVFWGRDPGSETSFLKLLLGDGERAGALRKLLVIIAQRKNVMLHFAYPVNFQKLVARTQEPQAAAVLLARTLSFYFSRRKTASLGPSLLSRHEIINLVLRRPAVREAMQEEQAEEKLSAAKIEKKARKMADEVAANFDSRILRVLDLILSWVFRKIFSGIRLHHVERLNRTANDRQLVYMPSHRSHLDYLLISYGLYTQGLVPPHIAAGVNLNFWPVGGLLRRGGAFYIRRSFAGQKLYSAVFRSYLDVILGRGYPVEFFPEGGRSRTGRLLPPKKGMLAMTVESFLAQPARKVALVPVYVGYDKLVEGASYVKELRGAAKQSESAGGLLKATRIFKSSYGSPHVAFGEPIALEDCLSHIEPEWRSKLQSGDESFIPAVVDHIAQENMERVNSAAVINPIGLVAMILLSSPQRAMAEDELLNQIDAFVALLKRLPYSADVTLPEGSAREILDAAARTAGLSRIDHRWGPIITATGKEAVMLTYYRNSVMHVLAMPSLIARFFRHSEQVSIDELRESCMQLLPFLKRELFLRVDLNNCDDVVDRHIDNLVEQGLLLRRGESVLARPEVGSNAYAVLTGLGRILRETFERYTMSSLLLVHEPGETAAPRSAVEENLIVMAQRLSIVSGREAPEYFDKNLFRVYLDTLIDQNLLHQENRDGERWVRCDARLQLFSQRWVALLGPDVQQSMLQLIRQPTMNSDS